MRAYSWAPLVAESKFWESLSSSDWKSDSLSLTWAPTVQAGPASEKLRGKGYAFYHNKAPEYSDPLSAIARLVRLVLKSVGE